MLKPGEYNVNICVNLEDSCSEEQLITLFNDAMYRNFGIISDSSINIEAKQ